jgi:hypothetical protein
VYNCQVSAKCNSGSSVYTPAQSFTTQGIGCPDSFEANNTLSTAAAIPANATVSALIASSTDVDYFKFNNTTAQKNIKVSLSNLPADYDVILYNSSGAQVGALENSGTNGEIMT